MSLHNIASGATLTRAASIIWLHGLGDTGAGWASLPSAFAGRAGASAWRWQFPTAPTRAVTCSGGAHQTAWMDLDAIPVAAGARDDARGFAASAALVHKLIDAEVARGTPARDVFVGGFSQGAALALWAGTTYGAPLGGIVALSGWWPATLPPPSGPAARGARVLLAHGRDDAVVEFACAGAARAALGKIGGARIESHAFDGGHEFDHAAPAYIHAFVARALAE